MNELETQIICPQCKREWPEDCEQGRAVILRDKCIVCIIKDGEHITGARYFDYEPYEFRKIKND